MAITSILPASKGPRIRKNLGTPKVITGPTGFGLEDTYKWIQAQKVKATGQAMSRLASQGRWPKQWSDKGEITAYIGKTLSNRQFKNVDEFLGYVRKTPLDYKKAWRFEPTNVANQADIKAAADFAFRQVRSELGKIPVRTGNLRNSVMYMVREKKGAEPRLFFGDVDLQRSAELLIVASAEYASSVEAHYFQRVKNGGMVYQAAKLTAKRFPNVIVRFSYTNLDKLGLPLAHKYAVPYIRIALRGGSVKQHFARPGRNIRRRQSAYRRMSPHSRNFYDYHGRMTSARKKAGYKRQDGRHFGDDLFSFYSQRRKKLPK